MSYKRKVNDLERRLEKMAEILATFGAKGVIEDLVRRGQHKPTDAYPGDSMPEAVSSSGGNPTMTKALLDVEWVDRVAEALGDLEAELISAHGSLVRARNLKDYCEGIGYKANEREAALSECDCCTRTVANTPVDRIKGGLCPACYTAWLRYRGSRTHPDRARFIVGRREELEAEQERRRHVG